MLPLTFDPILKRIRWGGTRLGTVLGKPVGPETDYAESWEIADHASGQSIVAGDGPHAGISLRDLVRHQNRALFGRQSGFWQFPLLIKFLDANDWLSLQVHPDDAQSRQFSPTENGKTEAWVILDAEPGSRICAGLKEGVTRDAFVAALESGSLERTLHMVEVSAGDCVFVPAGTVHAIGPGILLAEVQQQSDMTFRLHDWGRVGSDGQPRELHIQQSLQCIDFSRGPVSPVRPEVITDGRHQHARLVESSYFRIDRHVADEPFSVRTEEQFRILIVVDGSVTVRAADYAVERSKGSTVLIPAAVPEVVVSPEKAATVLEVSVPWPRSAAAGGGVTSRVTRF